MSGITPWHGPKVKRVEVVETWPGTDIPKLANPFRDHGCDPAAPVQPSAQPGRKRGPKRQDKAFGTVNGTIANLGVKNAREPDFGRKYKS
mgnify:CR=1 FL=1